MSIKIVVAFTRIVMMAVSKREMSSHPHVSFLPNSLSNNMFVNLKTHQSRSFLQWNLVNWRICCVWSNGVLCSWLTIYSLVFLISDVVNNEPTIPHLEVREKVCNWLALRTRIAALFHLAHHHQIRLPSLLLLFYLPCDHSSLLVKTALGASCAFR